MGRTATHVTKPRGFLESRRPAASHAHPPSLDTWTQRSQEVRRSAAEGQTNLGGGSGIGGGLGGGGLGLFFRFQLGLGLGGGLCGKEI